MLYSDYVQLVERDYFGNVSANRQDAVLACFTADAEIVIRHGDNAPRILKGQPAADEAHLSDFWRHLNGNFAAQFTEFEHFVDLSAQRCAATFRVTLTPRPSSPYAAQGVQTLHNCNFFWLRDRLIAKMIVYYSNPGSTNGGSNEKRPTGYPPAAL